MAKLARIKNVMADEGHRDRLNNVVTQAKELGHTEFFNGIPVSTELLGFATQLQKAMPKVKFYPNTFAYRGVQINDENGVYQTTKQIRLCDEFFVYMDDFPFDLGRINYSDNGVKSDEYTYGVYSRKISNAKYALHREQHNMIMTSDVAKAVKNSLKYLIPYTTRELAQAFYEPMQSKVSRVLDEVRSKMHNGARDIVNNRMAILQEVQFLTKQGVEFTTPEFRELATKVDQLINDYKEQDSRNVSAFFVRFKQMGDETYADIQEVLNIREVRWDVKMNTTDVQALTYHVNELPQDIAGQIAVLNILENDGYVAGVGMKIDDSTFWVERG